MVMKMNSKRCQALENSDNGKSGVWQPQIRVWHQTDENVTDCEATPDTNSQ